MNDITEGLPTTAGCSYQYVVNVSNNSGTVIVGNNNVVNQNESTASTTLVVVLSEATPLDDETTDTRQQSYDHCAQCLCERSSTNDNGAAPATWESTPNVNNQQHRQNYKRGRRKDDKYVHEVSEFIRKKKNDHKRMKRQRRDSRCSTESSAALDEDTRDTTLSELALEVHGSDSFDRGLQKFHYCSMVLHPLRDNGRWDEFYRVTQQLLDQVPGDLILESIILLEKSVALNYQKELERSEDILNDAVKDIAQISGSVRRLLEALSNCYFAGLYRRKKIMLGKTEKCLQLASKYVSSFPSSCLPVAILRYEEGCYKRDFAAIGSKKEPAMTEAKVLMQQCVDVCVRLDPKQVYVGKLHFAIAKKANINLQCDTSASRNETIDKNSLVEAGESLDTLHNEDYSKMVVSQGAKIQQMKATVDLYYRIEKFPEAEKIAQEGLEIAQKLSFNLEKQPFQERLTDIRRKMTETLCNETFRDSQEIIDSSGSLSSKTSSENENV